MRRRGRKLSVELGGRYVDSVKQRAAVEVEGQRNHCDHPRRGEIGRQVGGRVRDYGDARGAQLKWSSSMCLWGWKRRRSNGRIATSVTRTSTVVKTAIRTYPKPTTIPTAATTQIVAAVVKPRTSVPCRRMAPAPRKPTPVTICAAMRVGSVRLPKAGSRATAVNRHDPTPTKAIVRIPAG